MQLEPCLAALLLDAVPMLPVLARDSGAPTREPLTNLLLHTFAACWCTTSAMLVVALA